MSYQKRNWKVRQPSLKKGTGGINSPSTETRAEKLARKEGVRARCHAGAQDHDRITSIMAGTRELLDGRRVDRHADLPHEGEREVNRRLQQSDRNRIVQANRAAQNFGNVVNGVERVSRRGRAVL